MNKQGIGLWIVVIALLILDIGVHCVRAQDTTPALVKTQELEIVNSTGQKLIDLRSAKDGSAVLALYDQKGNARAGMVADSDDGGAVQLLDTNGKAIVAINGGANPAYSLNSNDKELATFGLRQGSPTVALEDSAGTDRAYLGYDPKGDRAIFQLTDKNNKQTAEMALTPSYSIIDVTDNASTRRAGLKCTSDNAPSVFVADKNGDPTWQQTDSSSQ